RESWVGTTVSYRSMVASFDDGSRRRGDQRGMLVSVRGKHFVMCSFATLTDSRPPHIRNAAIYGSQAMGRTDAEGLDIEDVALTESALPEV
ncbi:hypothetical protein ACI4BE_28315, partial [Klebsiella pneumoniae]|uniref:hypothetical protein n=1 Tax=Klebsiella pneumoniae TaxID=573 RepID=UPI003854B401